MARALALAVLMLALAVVAQSFVLPNPTKTDRAIKTRVGSWFGNKKAKEEPPAAPAKGKGAAPQKKRATAMDYRGMAVDKDEDVIVPASEYFSNKNDPIVPILFAGLFVPIFGLLGWWLFSPAPEPVIEDQSQQASSVSYDQMMNKGVKAKARRF